MTITGGHCQTFNGGRDIPAFLVGGDCLCDRTTAPSLRRLRGQLLACASGDVYSGAGVLLSETMNRARQCRSAHRESAGDAATNRLPGGRR